MSILLNTCQRRVLLIFVRKSDNQIIVNEIFICLPNGVTSTKYINYIVENTIIKKRHKINDGLIKQSNVRNIGQY